MDTTAGTPRLGLACLFLLAAACGAGNDTSPRSDAGVAGTVQASDDRLLIVGQDLGAIRGYMQSACCPHPDGLTAYVDFYDILKPDDFYRGHHGTIYAAALELRADHTLDGGRSRLNARRQTHAHVEEAMVDRAQIEHDVAVGRAETLGVAVQHVDELAALYADDALFLEITPEEDMTTVLSLSSIFPEHPVLTLLHIMVMLASWGT